METINKNQTKKQNQTNFVSRRAHCRSQTQIITTDPKKFCFDLPKEADNNLEHEIYSIIKHDKLLAEHTIKNEVRQLFSTYKHGHDIHEQGKQ